VIGFERLLFVHRLVAAVHFRNFTAFLRTTTTTNYDFTSETFRDGSIMNIEDGGGHGRR